MSNEIRASVDKTIKRLEVESDQKWREIIPEIPAISFPADWSVKIIPPFGGAVARFLVMLSDHPRDYISVYLDWYEALGYMGGPYWEAYSIDGDCEQFLLNETEALIECIQQEIDRRRNTPKTTKEPR